MVRILLFYAAGTPEDKIRMFIIHYLMTADISEVCKECGWVGVAAISFAYTGRLHSIHDHTGNHRS